MSALVTHEKRNREVDTHFFATDLGPEYMSLDVKACDLTHSLKAAVRNKM
jgi:hypothetical protein